MEDFKRMSESIQLFLFSFALEAPFLGENLEKSGWGSSTKKQVSRFSSSGLGLKEKDMYS